MTPALYGGVALAIALAIYVFLPARDRMPFTRKTRLDFLEERRATVYDNLRDLNFEFRAGKYPEQDYRAQRDTLETEAATVLQEIDLLRSIDRKSQA
jgi:hypothetical protein